jgi:hypothetical protein
VSRAASSGDSVSCPSSPNRNATRLARHQDRSSASRWAQLGSGGQQGEVCVAVKLDGGLPGSPRGGDLGPAVVAARTLEHAPSPDAGTGGPAVRRLRRSGSRACSAIQVGGGRHLARTRAASAAGPNGRRSAGGGRGAGRGDSSRSGGRATRTWPGRSRATRAGSWTRWAVYSLNRPYRSAVRRISSTSSGSGPVQPDL